MPHDSRKTRIAVVGPRSGLSLAVARLAAVLAVQAHHVLEVTPGEDTDKLRRMVPDGLWSLKDPGGPSGAVYGPQRKGRGGKIKRW